MTQTHKKWKASAQNDDEWGNDYFKAKQQGIDLGERMMNIWNVMAKTL
ncbi:MAG: hypothetical protein ABIW34_05950 [Ginsengibacter sp.]